eukprot:5640399-Pleurochrysis_carterae.AAC.1
MRMHAPELLYDEGPRVRTLAYACVCAPVRALSECVREMGARASASERKSAHAQLRVRARARGSACARLIDVHGAGSVSRMRGPGSDRLAKALRRAWQERNKEREGRDGV